MVASTTLILLPVAVTQRPPLGVEQVLKCSIRGKLANVDLVVEGHIDASIIESIDGAADLVVASREILLLPLPKDTVEVAVVEIEKRI